MVEIRLGNSIYDTITYALIRLFDHHHHHNTVSVIADHYDWRAYTSHNCYQCSNDNTKIPLTISDEDEGCEDSSLDEEISRTVVSGRRQFTLSKMFVTRVVCMGKAL